MNLAVGQALGVWHGVVEARYVQEFGFWHSLAEPDLRFLVKELSAT